MGWSELNLEAEFPGDYSSDAQFYAFFIGIIITWLYPKYDLVIATVLASAWACTVLGLRSIANVEVQSSETEEKCFQSSL